MKVCGIQLGSYPGDYESNIKIIRELTERVVINDSPDLIAFTELMTSPYFCNLTREENFSYAETINGKTVQTMLELSSMFNTHIVGTFFEMEEVDGQKNYYNSAFVCSPSRGLIGRYRKVHLPKINSQNLKTDEKFYFEARGGGGTEFPVFELDNGFRIGILICFDRSFPEAWRSYAVQGVDLVIVPTATYGFRKHLYVPELCVRAMENNVYVLGVNKAGRESLEGETVERIHFGSSCLIDPFGDVLQELDDQEWTYLVGEIDKDVLEASKQRIDWIKERKPHIYQKYLTHG